MQLNHFADLPIPPELEACFSRHREHLASLILSLRSAGVDEQRIEAGVSQLAASYRDELIRAMKGMTQ